MDDPDSWNAQAWGATQAGTVTPGTDFAGRWKQQDGSNDLRIVQEGNVLRVGQASASGPGPWKWGIDGAIAKGAAACRRE
jgi:hypothetical protein